MALTRNPIIAKYHQVKAVVLRARPENFARRLRRDVDGITRGEPLTPAMAWEAYKRLAVHPCFADCGWLVQYGVYSSSPEEFHFSLVRQFETLQHWNDELVQVDLRLVHSAIPTLARLRNWDMWSFKYPTPQTFFAACEQRDAFCEILGNRSLEWKWDVRCNET